MNGLKFIIEMLSEEYLIKQRSKSSKVCPFQKDTKNRWTIKKHEPKEAHRVDINLYMQTLNYMKSKKK